MTTTPPQPQHGQQPNPYGRQAPPHHAQQQPSQFGQAQYGQPQYGYQPPPPNGYQPPPKKKRHVFRWVFLGIQVLFLLWIIGGLTASTPDCGPNLSAEACEAAQGIGTGIGIALILGVWITVDFILGITYLIFRKK